MSFFQKVVSRITHSGRLAPKWDFDAKSSITTNPTCIDINSDGYEEILFGTKSGKIICLDRAGKKLWEYDARKKMESKQSIFMDKSSIDSVYSQPIVINLHTKNQGIVFGNEAGVLTCLDQKGAEIWKYETKGAIRSSPFAYDFDKDGTDEIIFGSHDKNLYVLNSKGKLVWKFDAGAEIEATPTVSHAKTKKIVFGCKNGEIVCLSLDGKKLWSFKTAGEIHAQPVIADLTRSGMQTIIVGSSDGHLYTLDEEGKLIWDYRTKGRILSRVALHDVDKDGDLEIFFGSCDDQIHALSPNAQPMWTYETGFWIGAPVYITDVDGNGTVEVIAGSYDKNIYVLEAMGNLDLEYMPGISGIAQQSGSYTDFITNEPGKLVGKVIWKYFLNEIIISLGILHDYNKRDIIAGTKEGRLFCLEHLR